MYQIKPRVFEIYNGDKLTYNYREDTNDFNTILSIVDNDEYKTSQMTYSEGDTFVDIGAHIGGWSKLMEHLVPSAKIIAVEPVAGNIKLLRSNCNAHIIYKAMSNRSGQKKKIYLGDDSEGGRHHRFIGNVQGFRGEEFFEVETISLNDLLKDVEKVRVLKIDCEGAEYSTFRFASNETLKKIDYIIGEYHNPKQEKSKTRGALLKITRGLFEDISVSDEDSDLGGFWFKNKNV